MKRLTITRLLLSALVALLLLTPAFAQDSTAEPAATVTQEATQDAPVVINIEAPAAPASTDTTSPFIYVAYGGLVLVLIAVLFNIAPILKIIAPLVPLETALKLAAQVTPTAADIALNQLASKTPTVLDDQLLIAALREKGYTVTGIPGGYHVEPTPIVGVNTTPDMFTSTGTPPLP